MYFLVDAIFIVLLIFLIWVSIKFGFTRNFVFGIIRTVIGIAGAIGACVGVYLLMDNFGWLDFMADGVANFFGMGVDLRIVAKIVAYLPFAVLFLIVGYIVLHKLINWLVKLIFLPFFYARKHVKAIKIIDNVLGLVLNLGLYFGIILASFGFIHGVNTVVDKDGTPVYDSVGSIISPEEDGFAGFAADTVNKIVTPMFDNWHENLTAAPISGLIYEYNPLNGMFEGVVKNIFGIGE